MNYVTSSIRRIISVSGHDSNIEKINIGVTQGQKFIDANPLKTGFLL